MNVVSYLPSLRCCKWSARSAEMRNQCVGKAQPAAVAEQITSHPRTNSKQRKDVVGMHLFCAAASSIIHTLPGRVAGGQRLLAHHADSPDNRGSQLRGASECLSTRGTPAWQLQGKVAVLVERLCCVPCEAVPWQSWRRTWACTRLCAWLVWSARRRRQSWKSSETCGSLGCNLTAVRCLFPAPRPALVGTLPPLRAGHIPPSLRGRGRGRKGRKRKGSASAAETGHQVAQLYWERLAALLAERQALGADFDLAVFSWAHPQSLMQGRSYEAAAGAAKGKAPQPIFGPVRGILSCALTDQLTCTAGQWPTDPREPQAIAARGAVATGGYVVPFEERGQEAEAMIAGHRTGERVSPWEREAVGLAVAAGEAAAPLPAADAERALTTHFTQARPLVYTEQATVMLPAAGLLCQHRQSVLGFTADRLAALLPPVRGADAAAHATRPAPDAHDVQLRVVAQRFVDPDKKGVVSLQSTGKDTVPVLARLLRKGEAAQPEATPAELQELACKAPARYRPCEDQHRNPFPPLVCHLRSRDLSAKAQTGIRQGWPAIGCTECMTLVMLPPLAVAKALHAQCNPLVHLSKLNLALSSVRDAESFWAQQLATQASCDPEFASIIRGVVTAVKNNAVLLHCLWDTQWEEFPQEQGLAASAAVMPPLEAQTSIGSAGGDVGQSSTALRHAQAAQAAMLSLPEQPYTSPILYARNNFSALPLDQLRELAALQAADALDPRRPPALHLPGTTSDMDPKLSKVPTFLWQAKIKDDYDW